MYYTHQCRTSAAGLLLPATKSQSASASSRFIGTLKRVFPCVMILMHRPSVVYCCVCLNPGTQSHECGFSSDPLLSQAFRHTEEEAVDTHEETRSGWYLKQRRHFSANILGSFCDFYIPAQLMSGLCVLVSLVYF